MDVLVKQQLERDLVTLKKAVDDHKKVESERKAHAIQQEKQLQKLQLLLQQVNNDMREATLQIQAVRTNERGLVISDCDSLH